MQGDAVEHLDLGTALDDQPFHHVEAVQLPLYRGDLGQMPTRWWRGTACAFLAVQGPRRSRMRLMVRTEGSGSILRPLRASWMASAPRNPRSLTRSNSVRTVRTSSSMAGLVREDVRVV